MTRVAVIGVGYLGRFHAQKYAAMDGVQLVGVVDPDEARGREVSRETGAPWLRDFRGLIGSVDACSVVVPTIYHHEVAMELLSAGVHCLVEKPIATTVKEAEEMIQAAEEAGVVLQVGHIERFNPAVELLVQRSGHALFIEAHRLGRFTTRATDVDVVLDLMIHDIDIVLTLVDQPVEEIRAAGLPVFTPKIDIANARIIFKGGCTANLTASRISQNPMRRVRVFQQGAYLSADCARRSNLVLRPGLDEEGMPRFEPDEIEHGDVDILNMELVSFVRAINGLEPPRVSGEDGRDALELALEINTQIHNAIASAQRLPKHLPYRR